MSAEPGAGHYDNLAIKEKIKQELQPLLSDEGFRRVFIASSLLRWIGQQIEASFLRSVTGCDAYVEIAKFREISSDLFKLDDDDIEVRSAILAEYVVTNLLGTQQIIDSIYEMVIEAVKRKRERRYNAVMSELLQVSNLRRILRHDPHYTLALVKLFDRLHRDIDLNEEPLFWLQYTILMIDAGDLGAAEKFLGTAYDRGRKISAFRTYQIDTQALRVYLLLETRDVGSPNVGRFDKIVEAMEFALTMIADESHRGFAIRVLDQVEPFIKARITALSTAEKNALVVMLNRFINGLGALTPDARAQTGADQIKSSLIRANGELVK